MTRAPIKLSRELKLLLLLLLMVALIGAWYVWTNSRATDALAQPDSTPVASGPAGTETDPTAPGTVALPEGNGGEGDGGVVPLTAGSPGGADTVTLDVQPNRPVEVEVIPPFPTPQVEDEDAGTEAAVATGGINPQASLATVPRNNPFRPLDLDPSTQTATAPAASPDAAPNAGTSPEFTAPLTRSPEPQTVPIASSNAGPLALSPIPGAGGSVEVASGDTSGLPVIPGGNGSTEAGTLPETAVSGNVPGRTVSGTSSDSGVTVIGGTGNVPGASGTPDQGSVVVTAPKPIVPPVAGVRVPNVSRVPVVADRAATDSAGRPGANGASGSPVATTSRPVSPSAPQIIAELAQAAGASGTGESGAAATGPTSKLEQFVQSRGLIFNAAVLGPINTAIFRSQDGYVVVAVGQNLPDSQITVKEVDATSATLSLGNDLKTLELDQR